VTTDEMLAAVEQMLDDAGLATTHLVGNSLGGYLALRLAQHGRAESVVALAPAGGWGLGDPALAQTLALFPECQEAFRALAPHVDAVVATAEGRRRAASALGTRFDHIPPALVAHVINATASARGRSRSSTPRCARAITSTRADHVPGAARLGTEDALLPWPSSAARYRPDWLPHADWVELDGVGHARSSTSRWRRHS
jgi:pimeloyl-ACP methyl ester carboxylesterase